MAHAQQELRRSGEFCGRALALDRFEQELVRQSLENRETNCECLSESRGQKSYQRAKLQHKVGGVLDVASGARSDAVCR